MGELNSPQLEKARIEKGFIGIEGFDEITHGGLPRNRTTLLVGSAGTGKIVFALQYPVFTERLTTGIQRLDNMLEGNNPEVEATELQFSTIADTWIHVSYIIQGGERNRALTIIKSRGTAHSNQGRELILSKDGLNLEEVHTAGGVVLMGTLRWEKELAQEAEHARVLDAEQARIEQERINRLEAIKQRRRSEPDQNGPIDKPEGNPQSGVARLARK